MRAQESQRYDVHPAEVFEEERFAFHNRQTSGRTDVAQAQNSGPVRYDGNRVALVRVLVHVIRAGLNGAARRSHSRSVPNGKVIKVADGAFERGLQFTTVVSVQTNSFGVAA